MKASFKIRKEALARATETLLKLEDRALTLIQKGALARSVARVDGKNSEEIAARALVKMGYLVVADKDGLKAVRKKKAA